MSRTRILSAAFFVSGAASLIYQIVWQRLLTLYYGVGAVSITLIVTVYMLGLGLGALAGGRLVARINNRLFFYIAIEFALGLFGIGSLHFLSYIGKMTAGSDYPTAFFCMFLFLCLPTLLMGMTLPLLVQLFSSVIPDFQRNVSHLYFINTLGAAAGAVIAGYGIISIAGLDGAVYLAAGLNFVLAALIFTISGNELTTSGLPSGLGAVIPDDRTSESLGRFAFAAVFATGFLALAYEIIWFRMIGVLIKDSAYAFSSILSVYLAGVACGSYGIDRFIRANPGLSRRDLFYSAQAGIGVYVLGSVCLFMPLVRYNPLRGLVKSSFLIDVHPTLPSFSGPLRSIMMSAGSCADVFVWPAVFCFIPAMCMGATFPLLSMLSPKTEGFEGKIVGNLYFWNVMGNVAGGFAAGFVLLPFLGTERTIMLLGAAGIGFFIAARSILHRPLSLRLRIAVAAAVCFAALVLAPGKGELYKAMHFPPGPNYDTYISEGVEGVVLNYVDGEKVRMYIGGSSHGERPGYFFYNEAIEALSFARNPRRILVIGYGTGSIVEIALRTPGVEKVTLVELNGTVMRNLSRIPLFQRLLADPRIETVLDDGRRFLLRTSEQFDAVLIDPLRTTTAYSGNLYSREFFRLAKEHLKPDGVFLVWMDEYRVMPDTLASVFPSVRMYGDFAVGSPGSFGVRNEERRAAVLGTFTAHDRAEIGRFSCRTEGREYYMTGTPDELILNTDLRPVTEYYLGLGLRAWPAGLHSDRSI